MAVQSSLDIRYTGTYPLTGGKMMDLGPSFFVTYKHSKTENILYARRHSARLEHIREWFTCLNRF